jgi:hypothetical protein
MPCRCHQGDEVIPDQAVYCDSKQEARAEATTSSLRAVSVTQPNARLREEIRIRHEHIQQEGARSWEGRFYR